MQWTAQGQREWGWKIALYLFAAGVGAGSFAVAIAASRFGPVGLAATRAGIVLGFPSLLIGSLLLVSDLGVKPRAWRAFLRPSSSWIARGTIIISGFMILAALPLAASLWSIAGLEPTTVGWNIVAALGFVFAILTLVYTGVLLGASRAITLWSTAVLPMLFLVSGLSTGSLGTSLVLLFPPDSGLDAEAQVLLARAEVVVLALEALVLAFYLQATHRVEESRSSARLIVRGELRGRFWFGVVFLGLVVPFATSLVELLTGHAGALVPVGAVCGLVGGLLLRHVVLAAGAKAPLRAAGIEYQLPTGMASGFAARRM